MVSGQLADKPTRGHTVRRWVNLQTE